MPRTCQLCDTEIPRLRRLCDAHLAESKKAARQIVHYRALADGKCRVCYKPRGKDGTRNHCRPCADKATALSLARRRRLIEQGRCPICRAQHASGLLLCSPCADRENRNKRERRRS